MRNSTTYKIAGTKTFRLASSKVLRRWGSNLQNVEKSMREIYTPDPGMIFVQTDQAGAEALIVSYLTRDGKYRSLFKNGIKPHQYVCAHLFTDVWPRKMRDLGFIKSPEELDMNLILNAPIAELKNNPLWGPLKSTISDSDNWANTERYYYLGKQTEHSSNYDIQPPTFRMNILEKSGGKIVISKDDSIRFIATKHALYPEIKEDFHAGVRRQVEQTRCLYNLHGHPYKVTQAYIKESDWKEYFSWVPQSTVAIITRKAYIAMADYIEQNNLAWSLLADTHDSYLIMCPLSEVIECARKAKEFMEQTLVSPFDGTTFKMGSETSAGFNWRPFHVKKNPTGLKELKI